MEFRNNYESRGKEMVNHIYSKRLYYDTHKHFIQLKTEVVGNG